MIVQNGNSQVQMEECVTRRGAFHYHGYDLVEYAAFLDDPNDSTILDTNHTLSPALQPMCRHRRLFSFNAASSLHHRTLRLPFSPLPALERPPLPRPRRIPRLSLSPFLSALHSTPPSTSWSHLRFNPLFRPRLAYVS